MTMLNTRSAKKNEKGIALIFSLIMLSLLLILALSFTLDSMFEQKAAYNSASSSSSGFMGQAQLKQVLLLLKEGEANFDSTGRLYSHDSGTVTDTDMLKEKLPVDGVLFENDGCFDPAVKVNWNYIKDADDKIIGRTAFVLVPEEKIPLDSLVDERVGTTAYPKHDEQYDTETRVGKYTSEINVRAAIPAVTTDIAEIAEVLNWTDDKPVSGAGFTDGKYIGSWLSFSSLFTTIKDEVRELNDTEKTEFESKLTLTTTKDAEAFWAEASGGDNKVGNGEIYNRFDLTRADWSTSLTNVDDVKFIKNAILLDSDGDGEPDLPVEAWDGNDSLEDFSNPDDLTKYSKGLPWLACFGFKTDGTQDETLKSTFASVKDRRYQIAANLKDYCDTDKRATSDVDPATWSTLPSPGGYVHPAYTGNDKTPYINKVGMKISTTQNQSGTNPYVVWAGVVISPTVELINIYGNSCSDLVTVKIEGSITIRIQVDGATTTTSKTQSFSCSVNVNPWEWTDPGYSKFTMDSSTPPFNTNSQVVIGGSRMVDFEVTQINFTKVVLVNGTEGWDYTKNLLADYASPLLIELNSGFGYKHLWYGFAVHDPRQNLNGTTIPSGSTDPNDADWKILTPLETTNPADVFSIGASGGASNATNSSNGTGGDDTDVPSVGPDPETTTDPASGISTAYSRNASMESPWELGFIHRGARWETLNLKKYDTNKAFQLVTIGSYKYILGGGAYNTTGDANILDQIKMTKSAKSPPKINLCSKANLTFDVLFSKIKLKPTIDSSVSVSSMAGGSDTEMLAGVSTIISNVIAKFATTNTTNLTRASVVDKLVLPLGTTITATTDAAQEELIGKIVNLTKVGEQSGDFALIVLSQTINDIGGVGSPSVTVYKVPADGSAALPVPCQIGVFDVAGTDADWTKNAYGDDITGEQKIMVKGNTAVDGTITIKSFQYID